MKPNSMLFFPDFYLCFPRKLGDYVYIILLNTKNWNWKLETENRKHYVYETYTYTHSGLNEYLILRTLHSQNEITGDRKSENWYALIIPSFIIVLNILKILATHFTNYQKNDSIDTNMSTLLFQKTHMAFPPAISKILIKMESEKTNKRKYVIQRLHLSTL